VCEVSGGQFAASELRDRVAFDLTYALRGDPPDLADVGELGLAAIEETVATTYDVGGPRVELGEHLLEPSAFLGVEHQLVGARSGLTGDQVTERRVAVLLDGRVE